MSGRQQEYPEYLSTRVTAATIKKVQKIAREKQWSDSQTVRILLEEALAQRKNGGEK